MTNDGLVNVASGLGTAKSKRENNKFMVDILGQTEQLEAAYLSDWLAAKIVNIPADDSTREWRRFKCKDAEQLTQAEEEYSVQTLVREARTWARLYGGAGIIPIIDNLSLEEPLILSRIKRGSLKRFMVFDNRDLIPGMMNTTDILKANFNMPETYTIRGGSTQIHWTWVARFNGLLLPKRYMTQTRGWGDSSLRKCIQSISDMVSSVGGIAELMQEANIDVITRDGLSEDLASDQDGAIIDRYALFSQMKSIVNMALLDGNEKLDRQTLNLGGVAPVIELLMTWISAAAETPVTKLFGTSAKGMNATGEGDESNYYDMIRSQQTNDIAPGLQLIDDVLIRSTFGDPIDDFAYEWNPLKQSSALDIATARHMDAQRHDMLLQAGVVERGQVMQELQANELYQYEDGQIEDALDFDEPVDIEQSVSMDEFNEANINRKANGQFGTGGSGASSSKPAGGSSSTQRGTGGSIEANLKQAESAGFNTEEVFTHASSNSEAITDIKSKGNFPGLFALPSDKASEAAEYGDNSYSFVIKGEPVDNSDINEYVGDNWSETEDFIRENVADADYLDDDVIEHLSEIIIGNTLEETDESMSALAAIDTADFFKEAQSLRIKFATKMGAAAVTMEDEFGTDTVVLLPGPNVMMVSGPGVEE